MSEEHLNLPAVSQLRSRVESLLLVSDEPVAAEELAEACSVGSSQVEDVLRQIAEEFDARGSGFDLREREGLWRLYTRPENSDVVEAKILQGTQQRLSRAALETLAVVAYRQPVTRSQVAAVRGVNCDGVMRTLALRGLIRQVEVAAEGEEETAAAGPGGAHLYETTDLLLEQLGIESLDELPDLAPLLPDVESIESDY
ncbi:SMC-Scp complex subunit ScpB [Corynebacterium sp. MSK039]|mgnify:FL=1|uniref:SMC-Scp complex subunit ScpB n=1 Tax=Corynebacterium sp. MSK039 TaxID=3050193 RepID=UPI00254DC2E6|nr:SMC-Scp complex subunit ScpB [Corynebacterium sp. MSK039]MDK8790133.1 SMC-Scp complex subunit ScpB [Corynebacterium sp. MSK039]